MREKKHLIGFNCSHEGDHSLSIYVDMLDEEQKTAPFKRCVMRSFRLCIRQSTRNNEFNTNP